MDPGTLRRTRASVDDEVLARYVDLGHTAPSSAAVRAELRSLLRHSLVLAVVITALFSYSGGQQPESSGWTMSLFVLLYLFCCSISYSTADTPLAKIFVALSYIALVAFCVRVLISSVLGMVLIYLDSILAAGLFGDVLAQHRQIKFTERAALVAAANAPLGKYESQLGIYLFLALIALFFAACWALLPIPHYRPVDVLINLFGALGVLQFIHIICVLGWLNGAVFGVDSSPPVIGACIILLTLFTTSYLLAGELVAAMVLWLCVLVSSAFLGYYLRVHATYETMMTMRNVMLASIADITDATDATKTKDKED